MGSPTFTSPTRSPETWDIRDHFFESAPKGVGAAVSLDKSPKSVSRLCLDHECAARQVGAAQISPIQENIFNRRKFVRPRYTTSTIYVCSDTAYCVRCRGEIDCSHWSLYPSPACRPLKRRLHLQRRSVGWTTAAHDARRICGTKDGGRRDPRSASRHRRYRHATASSRNVSSCSRH